MFCGDIKSWPTCLPNHKSVHGWIRWIIQYWGRWFGLQGYTSVTREFSSHFWTWYLGHLHGLTDILVGQWHLAPGFKLQPGYVSRILHPVWHLITFWSYSVYLAYIIHKSGLKIATWVLFLINKFSASIFNCQRNYCEMNSALIRDFRKPASFGACI